MRFFRAVSFQTKAIVICALLLIPAALLGWQYFVTQAAQIAFSQKERLGVAYLQDLHPVLVQVQEARRRLEAGQPATGHAAAWQRLDAAQARWGRDLDLEVAWAAVEKTRAELQGLPSHATPARRIAAHDGLVRRLIDLGHAVVDSSNLALDPDIDSYYLMSAITMRQPELVEHLDTLWRLGAAMLRARTRDQDAAQAVDGSYAIAGYMQVSSLSDTAKVKGANEVAAAALAYEPVAQATAEFLKLVDEMIVQGGLLDDPQPFAAAGQRALEAQNQLTPRALGVLDGLLEQRVARMETQRWLMGCVSLVALLLAGYMFHCFYRVMRGGLEEVRRHLMAITAGDLTTSPRPWGRDEPASLMGTLQQMQESLRHIVASVRRASVEIEHSSSEIAAGANDLSARTEQSAANLEETAASMEQISSTVRQTADHAQQASGIAGDNAQVAAAGGRVIADLMTTMSDIQAASGKISEIISVIDGIAFQTNILALNAAVEAARAGEQGKGFAVVASEVRALAGRSAAAAREIKGLIAASAEKVGAGSQVVESASGTMRALVERAEQIAGLLQQISVGSTEQSTGVLQVGQAVHDLDRVAQQNAALVEQTAAASLALKDHALQLSAEVSRFSLPSGYDVRTDLNEPSAPVDGLDVDGAIEAHRAWKVKLRTAIAQRAHLDAPTICRDDACKLGQWLQGAGGQRYGGRPAFVALVDSHRAFHREAGRLAQVINQGNYEEAGRALEGGTEFARCSNAVATALTRLKREG